MNKFFIYLLFFFLLISCSNNSKKNNLISKSIDYEKLNSFVKDSLPSLLILNENFDQIFNAWQGLKTIESTSKIMSSDPRTLPFFLESLKLEVAKINDKQIPGKFNVPQVIGRFRVYKTEVLKINSNKIDLENIDLFKKNLKKIAISHNALISMMNKIAKESLEPTNSLEAVEVK